MYVAVRLLTMQTEDGRHETLAHRAVSVLQFNPVSEPDSLESVLRAARPLRMRRQTSVQAFMPMCHRCVAHTENSSLRKQRTSGAARSTMRPYAKAPRARIDASSTEHCCHRHSGEHNCVSHGNHIKSSSIHVALSRAITSITSLDAPQKRPSSGHTTMPHCSGHCTAFTLLPKRTSHFT